MKLNGFLAAAAAVALATAACETTKSSNPLSPTVAGPIPGVEITAPRTLEPAAGWNVDASTQPLTLLIENSSTNGVRPLNYLFEVALDAGFTNRVFSREGIAPGSSGRTSLKLPDSLPADRTYYWRARAQDGANTGPYSAAANFVVFTPIVLHAPTPVSPINSAVVTSVTPTLVFTNAERSGPVGAMSYSVQVSTSEAFTTPIQLDVPEQPTQTATATPPLANDSRYYWRVRAFEGAKTTVGPWSATQTFLTPPPTPTPTPTPTPDPTPNPGTWPSNGPAVLAYVAATYPSYLRAGVSSSQRTANLEFLRDRIIETGLCGGMKLGWNLKRGGPEKSVDYITYYTGGRWIGVDFAMDSDNTSNPVQLYWGEVTDDPYTTHADYSPLPSCK